MPELPIDPGTLIYQEMLAHPVLFSHRHPQKIALMGEQTDSILAEILKHPTILEAWHISNTKAELNDARIQHHPAQANQWAPAANPDYFDICIMTDSSSAEMFPHYFKALHTDGIFLQLCGSLFEVHALKTLQQQLFSAGFSDILILSFSQPHFSTGWRCAVMAKKSGVFKKIREKDIFNKTFVTHYYNFDIHKAALAMPEFMRQELIDA